MLTQAGSTPWKRTIRGVFIAVPFLCLIQYLTTVKFGEPYPALSMPGFSGTGGYEDGRVQVQRMEVAVISSTGVETTFSQRDWFSDFPDALHGSLARCFFSPVSAADHHRPESYSPSGLRARLLPGLDINRSREQSADSLGAWVRQRARALVPGPIQRVNFHWYVDTFDHDAGVAQAPHRKRMGTFSVLLNEQ